MFLNTLLDQLFLDLVFPGGKRFKGDRLPQWATDLVAAFLVALLASLKPYAELRCENAPNTDELPRTIRF